MALRREMMFEVVRDVMNTMAVTAGAYRFKVMPMDRRGHAYIVLVDLSTHFISDGKNAQRELQRLGRLIETTADTRFHLLVPGVYWRIDPNLMIERAAGAEPDQDPSIGRARMDSLHTSTPSERARLVALEKSIAQGTDVQVGGRIYDTDLSPLTPQAPDEFEG